MFIDVLGLFCSLLTVLRIASRLFLQVLRRLVFGFGLSSSSLRYLSVCAVCLCSGARRVWRVAVGRYSFFHLRELGKFAVVGL